MAITNQTQGRISCPNCSGSGPYNFEKKVLTGIRPSRTPGIYDSSCELGPKTVYVCIICGWALGQPENDTTNKQALAFVERRKRLEAQQAARKQTTDEPDTAKGSAPKAKGAKLEKETPEEA